MNLTEGVAADASAGTWQGAFRKASARSERRRILRNLLRRKTAFLSLVILLAITLSAIFAFVIAPYSPYELHIPQAFQGPSLKYLFGTDETGRDQFSVMLFASRVSLLVALASEVIALALGTPYGLIAGYLGGRVDSILMRILDGFLSFPGILLALTIVAVFGPGLVNLIIAIGILNARYIARVARAAAVAERGKDYVMAARAIGASDWHIMWVETLRNCMAPLIVQGTLGMAFAVLTEATLSFLGLGIQPPSASLGTLLQYGYSYIWRTPWYVTFPGLEIVLIVWSINLLGDGLRDALDPRLRRA